LNAIEEYFNQLKHYIKIVKPILFEDIKKCIIDSIKKIKIEHYKNYFLHAYDIEKLKSKRKTSNRRKIYKK
jgi:hypothetical protein